jgi:large subunit ribosomal protein L15
MTVNKRKKITRARGSHTHGGGAMKKRRGAGNRGGRGNAGSGKRGDAKKPSNWNTKYFGKTGFISINKQEINTINLSLINQKLDSWTAQGLIEKKGSEQIVDLKKLGYDKLLGAGTLNSKITIHVNFASAKAQSKVEQAGGKLVLPQTE